MKTLNNTDIKGAREQVFDLEVFGDGDMFRLLCKASSKREGWMKSTKAMEVPGVGCVVQVTTQQAEYSADRICQGHAVAEALCFVPGVVIDERHDEKGVCIGRKLIQDPYK